MQPLEEQEDPSFSSVVETPQLQRPHCDQCRVAIADYECQRCVQRFCTQCELVIHHRLEALALKHEESKGDGRPHQEFLKWIRGCQECGQSTMEFMCVSCNMYQCESCCAAKHKRVESHFFFCLEGSSPRMFPFAAWNVLFVEMVKMRKGELQDKLAEEEAPVARKPAKEIPEEKYSTTAVAHIKMEKALAATRDTAMALGNLSIHGAAPAVTPLAEQPTSQAKRSSRFDTTSIVDLTLDDESDSHTSTSSVASSRQLPQPQIKEEVHVKTESAWLDSATAARENPVFDVDELMEKTMGDDEDPILRSMITEYNQLSAKIFDIDQKTDSVRKNIKELSSAQPMNMNEFDNARAMTAKLRKDKTEAEKSRDGVVANIVVYVKPNPDELKAFLKTCTANVPYALTASHRKCATLEASIRAQLEKIQKIQRNMEELINMKKDAFAEVTRLGAEIAEGEEEVRKLDKDRQDEFLCLCQFSNSIQNAVRAASSL